MMSSEKVLAKSMVPSWPHLAKKSCKQECAVSVHSFITILGHIHAPLHSIRRLCMCWALMLCRFTESDELSLQAQEAGLACASWTKYGT